MIAEVAGVPFEIATVDEAVSDLLHAASLRSARAVHFANAYTLSLAHGDKAYAEMLRRGTVYPDGKPVVWVMRLSVGRGATRRPEQVAGPRVFERALGLAASAGLRPFLLGGTEEDLAAIETRAAAECQQFRLGGMYSPPFAPLSDEYLDDCARRIEESGSDLVWIGLGTPKQDWATARLAERLGIPCVAVGAAFAFYAGRVKEPPRWMQAIGLGWFHRLLSEPGRLWRRYLVGNSVFLWAAMTKYRRGEMRS